MVCDTHAHTHTHTHSLYRLYKEVADLLQQDHYPAGFTVELRPDPQQTHLLHHSRHVVSQLPITDRVQSQSDDVTAVQDPVSQAVNLSVSLLHILNQNALWDAL